MSKSYNIQGKEVSEDTIIAALKSHIGFEEKKPRWMIEVYRYVNNEASKGKRVVVRLPDWAIDKIKEGFKSVVLDTTCENYKAAWGKDSRHDYTAAGYLTDRVQEFGKLD